MKESVIFEILTNQVDLFFKKFSLNYKFKENKTGLNNKIKGRNYKTYSQIWYNDETNLSFYTGITFYIDSDSKPLISKIHAN